ncbi:polyubiquitin-like [Cottoperca gobio]|uniref:Polyubiquitin-like n=1 Tax=Cottoperca gobio TaxID=56716 RepID=A0A6J2QER5_COTGO|nr:polyubiquitin-like [Cottoperca gobio]
MDIIIKMSHTLRVQPQDTVGSLKIRIQKELGVQCENQRLSTPLTDDSMSLSSYGLHSGAMVSLLVTQPAIQPVTQPATQPVTQPATIQVFLRNEKAKMSTYDIKPDETVSNFRSRVESREGITVDQQRLIHQGRDMNQGKLSDYNVRSLSTIDLMLRLRGD